MKTIPLVNYEVKSIPGVSVNLPEEALKQADGLMKCIVESKDSIDLFRRVEQDPLLMGLNESGLDESILIKANYLRHSKVDSVRSLTFKDQIYVGMGSDYLKKEEDILSVLPLRTPIEAIDAKLYRNFDDCKATREKLKLNNEGKE
jgi:hypothetical protein